MKKFALIISLFLLTTFSAEAQLSKKATPWQEGIIILNNEQVINGEISYDYFYDVVLHRADGLISTYTPQQFISFMYYDEKEDLYHNFVSLDNELNPKYQQKAIYEVVLEGKVNYVRKRNKYPTYEPKKGYLANKNRRLNQHKVAYEYFVQYGDRLIKSRRFKQEVLPLMLDQEQSLAFYMKENNLKSYQVGDQIELVRYFNNNADYNPPTASSRQAR